MKIIVGLGNPGEKYKNTRHNLGYRVVDTIAKNQKFKRRFESDIIEGVINDEKVLLIKPQTFMNDSGKAVRTLVDFYKINPKNIWVISDDIDLLVGKIRIRTQGSSGGHKGLQSIIDSLGSQKFPRIRIGIRNPEADKIPREDYVLQKFNKKERDIISEVVEKSTEEIKNSLKQGIGEKTLDVG